MGVRPDAANSDGRRALLAQIEALSENLDRGRTALETSRIDGGLRAAVDSCFRNRIASKSKELEILQSRTRGATRLEAYWGGFRQLQKECGDLLREVLAFLEGALMRSAGLDADICRIADALLGELDASTDIRWQRFTIMADRDLFVGMSEIIRISFPEFSVWNLPVAAHEFGHLVAEELHRNLGRDPFGEILESEGKKPEAHGRQILNEFFADLFATYALGPAFACTATLLRFDVGDAHRRSPTHPTAAERMHLVFKTLEKLNQLHVAGPYSGIIEQLRQLWEGSLDAADQPPLEAEVARQLDSRLNQLYELLDNAYSEARYASFSRAWTLAENWQAQPDELTLRDVLNAAWLCRLRDRGENQTIGRKALKTCFDVIDSPGRQSHRPGMYPLEV